MKMRIIGKLKENYMPYDLIKTVNFKKTQTRLSQEEQEAYLESVNKKLAAYVTENVNAYD
jgi:hypothetical protein